MHKPTITDFLEARIAEDEALASAAAVGMHGKHKDAFDWGGYVLGLDRDSTPKQDEFITEWWPARVLAECAAKRATLRRYESYYATRRANWMDPSFVMVLDELRMVLGSFAAVYASHPDYQQEWAL